MNKVRCRACGSARTPSAVTTSPGWRGKQPSMGRKLGSAELNRLARDEGGGGGGGGGGGQPRSVSRSGRKTRQTKSVQKKSK